MDMHLEYISGNVCKEGEGNASDYVCKRPENCSSLERDIRRQNFPPICSFVGNKPVVCCSPADNNNNSGADNNRYKNGTNRPAAAFSFAGKPTASSSYSATESTRQTPIIIIRNSKIYMCIRCTCKLQMFEREGMGMGEWFRLVLRYLIVIHLYCKASSNLFFVNQLQS